MGILRVGRLPTAYLLGQAGINLGAQDVSAGNLINIFKAATLSFNDPTDALKVDADGYLTSTPTNSVNVTFSSAGSTYVGSTYRLKWPSTIQFKMQFNSSMTLVGSPTGATVTGGTGSGSTTITTTSGAGQVDFVVGASQPSCFFPTTGTFSRSGGELAMYRVTDEADYLAGEYWTPEFKARLVELHCAYIRPMGWVNGGPNNFNGEVSWGYRLPTTAMCWGGNTRVIPSACVGNISGTDTYTCGAATDTPGTWTDGEIFIGNVLNQNTSTTPTINVNGRGAKNILSRAAAAIVNTGSGSSRIVTGLATFRYDAILDAVLYSPGLYQTSLPVEAQIQLANRVGTGLWMVLPMWADDTYVTSQATLANSTLSGRAYYEYSNEIWNNTWPQTGWSRARGQALGWTSSSNQDVYGWYGLRVRQIMGNLLPAVYGGSLSTKARRVLAYQGGGFLTIAVNRMNGPMLNTGIGNAVYSTLSGSQNYDTFPNRPVDVCDSIAYAPYTGGTNFCRGADIAGTLGTANAPFYQALVDAWLSGDSATAISMIDSDIRDGRVLVQNVTASGTTFTTSTAHGFTTSDDVYFDVSGGTAYSGITTRVPYHILSTPTSTTFTIQGYVAGVNTGSAVNSGSSGTGTVTVGRVGKNILYQAYWMPSYADVQAATYDAARTGAGMALLRADQYEGNLEPLGPTAAECTTMGITGWTAAQASQACTDALEAWRNSSLARATSKHYYEAMTGRTSGYGYPSFTHNYHTSQLVLSGPGVYGLTSGPLPTDAPYQMYYGFMDFNLAYPQ